MTEQEKSQIRAILSSPSWKTIEQVAETIRSEIKDDSCLRATSVDTIKTVAYNEGKRDGIRDLIQRLYNEISQ